MDPIATAWLKGDNFAIVILEGRSPDRIKNNLFFIFFKAIRHPFTKIHEIHKCRFAGTRRTRESHKLASIHRKIHALENLKRFTRLGENTTKIVCLE